MSVNIIGLNAFHGDSSACLLRDGKIIAAVEEERFNRQKHWAGFPAESIRFCLGVGGISMDQVDHVAVSFSPRANLVRKVFYTLLNRPSFRSIIDRLNRQSKAINLRKSLALAASVDPSKIRAKIHHVEHHDAHIASGFLTSPYEEAAVLSVDGMGDFISTALGHGEGNKFSRKSNVNFPHSIGLLYNAITLYLGFSQYGDEYKVMGLAPYGQPIYIDEFRKIIQLKGDLFQLNLDYFKHHTDGISMSWDGGVPKVDPFHSEFLEKRLGPALPQRSTMGVREQNIAASLQVVSEEVIMHLLNGLYRKVKSKNVVLVGGCAMNSVANGKICELTPYQNLFVPAGAADNGTCFGAALDVWSRVLGKPRSFIQRHGYLGPEFSSEECAIAASKSPVRTIRLCETDLLDRVVDALCEGQVVGWFQGRMEFGARALGNRSLLADPRRADMRDIINLKIKYREKFRPFAPSILRDRVDEYFEKDEPSPFMERVLRIRPEKRSLIPAVTHVDGSGRLQTVTREDNSLYYDLITRFSQRTGIPMLLNTSLNENEPIVHTPEQAISCFLRTKMDILVLGDLIVERS